jgi:putative glutamine amidotransferase
MPGPRVPRPLIGVEVDLETNARGRRYAKCYETYFDAIVDAGGAPLLVPPSPDEVTRSVLAGLAGLVVPGGDDFSAEDWGEEQRPCARFVASDGRRLEFGRRLMNLVLEQGRPYLGVCYGAQLLNLALGGTLVQDIPDEVSDSAVAHSGASHDVAVEGGTLLARVLGGAERIEVNSRHHQSVRDPGRGLRVSAQAPDGVVEAIEPLAAGPYAGRFLLGVQWHPEDMPGSRAGAGLFTGLIEAAKCHNGGP